MLCSLCSARRPGVFFLLLLLLPLWLSASPLVGAQWPNNRGYQLLQRVDDVLFGIDNLSLVILDRRYVSGTLVRVNVHQPTPVRGSAQFVADCKKPLRLALRPAQASGRPVPDELEFAPVKMLDGSWAAAEFACESTRQPGRASRLARELYERGGPDDMQTLYCELQPDGLEEARSGVEVRFSEEANAVAVNRQWLSSGQVSSEEVRFGTKSKWHINRQGLDVRRTAPHGEMMFSGTCDRRPPAATLRP